MKKYFWPVAGQAGGFVLQLLTLVTIARALGPGVQGEFATIRAAVFTGEALIWIGLNSGTSYLIAKEPGLYLGSLLRLSLGHLVLACLFTVCVVFSVGRYFADGNWAVGLLVSKIWWLIVWLFFQGTTQLLVRTLIAVREYGRANLVLNATAGLGLLVVVLLRENLTFATALESQIFGAVIGTCFGFFLLRRAYLQTNPKNGIVWRDWYLAIEIGMKGLVSTMAFLGLYRIDLFLVATFCDKKTSGIYAVASVTMESLQRASDWFAAVLTPQVASGITEGRREASRNSWLGTGIVLGGAATGYILIALGYDPFVRILGVDYSSASFMALLLIPKACLHCVMVSYAAILAGRGYTYYHPAAGIVALVVLLIVGLRLAPALGQIGAISSLTIAYLVAAGTMVVGVRKTGFVRQ